MQYHVLRWTYWMCSGRRFDVCRSVQDQRYNSFVLWGGPFMALFMHVCVISKLTCDVRWEVVQVCSKRKGGKYLTGMINVVLYNHTERKYELKQQKMRENIRVLEEKKEYICYIYLLKSKRNMYRNMSTNDK